MTPRRAVSNKRMTLDDYESAVELFLKTAPVADIKVKLGPLCKDLRHVTPAALLASAPLLRKLLQNGMHSGIIQASKFKEACSRVLLRNAALVGAWDLDEAVQKTCEHEATLLKLVRELKREDASTGQKYCRFPRTGGFRKKVKSHEWPIVWELRDLLRDDIDCNESGDKDEVHNESASRQPTQTHDDVECDDAGLPLVFATNVPRSQSALAICSHEDVECDDNGYPLIFSREPSRTSLDHLLEPIAPDPRKRKAEALARRPKGSKSTASRTTAPDHKVSKTTAPGHKLYSRPITSVTLSVTNKSPIRAELTTKIEGVRIHICTLHASSWGAKFHDDAKYLKQYIEKHTLTREAAVRLRDHVTNPEPRRKSFFSSCDRG